MRIESELKLDFDDVLIRPKRSTLSSRKDVNLQRTFSFLHCTQQWTGVPIIAANMDTVGTFEVFEVLKNYEMLTALHKFYTNEQIDRYTQKFPFEDRLEFLIQSTGSSYSEMASLDDRFNEHLQTNIICIDVANGYTESFVESVSMYRDNFPDSIIIAGNVVTGEMTEQLLLSGADVVKVGIGSGSVCTTRLKTGVGYPQLSAVIECADAAHGIGGHIISDGGCRTPADVAKAFAAGADFVMLGGMFAGHDETSHVFHGMSSKVAQELHYGEKKAYRAAEGKEVFIKSRGALSDTVEEILGGLRSACTYVGAEELKHLSKCTTFIRVNSTHNKVFE